MSSVSYESLNLSKKNLVEALEDNQSKYFDQMKDWFRGKMTKEEFDSNARDMLPSSTVHLHNEFLLAILTKCQLFSTTAPPTMLHATSSSGHTYTGSLSSKSMSCSAGAASINNSNVMHSAVLVPYSIASGGKCDSYVSGSAMAEKPVLFSRGRNNSSGSNSNNNSQNVNISDATSISSNINYYSNGISSEVPNDIFSTISSNNANNTYDQSSANLNTFANNGATNNNLLDNSYSSNNYSSNFNLNKFSQNSSENSINSNNFTHVNKTSYSIINSSLNTSGSSNTTINDIASYSNASNVLTTLGTSTNAITINNRSSNISIKVEVPLHSIEGNCLLGESGGGSLGFTTGSVLPGSDKKKISRPQKKKLKNNKQNNESVWEPIYLHSLAPAPTLREPHVLRDCRAGHHTRSHCLLGLGELRGRLLLAAWEHGLTAATEGVVRLLHHAAKQVLQNVLTAVVRSRGGFMVREGRFVHSIGTAPPNPWLRTASAATDWTADSVGLPVSGVGEGVSVGDRPPLWPTTEAAQQNAAHLLAFAPQHPPPHGPVTCFDLYTALKVSPWVLPCHSVYALCMERVSARLSHPDRAQLTQDALHRQEQRHRQHLRQFRT